MKKIINFILFFIMILILIWINQKKHEDDNIKNNVFYKNIDIGERIIIENNSNKISEKVQENYNGFKVSSKLVIPKINLETLVLENYSETALKTSVTKFWGVNANEIGNFCIAGHNFKNRNMFHDLKDLEIDDVLYIEDNRNGKYEYQIYDLYKVSPEDTSCLSQNTNGLREVTLITCTNDSKKRIIVKAKEI